MSLRYLSVCSGIEAASVGWQRLGWQCVGLSEIEGFPRQVLEQRLGAVPVDWDHAFSPQSNVLPLFGDFTKIEESHVGPVDLLVGGTPCQSFSIAGKRLGLDDPRGNLAIEFLALARRVRARWVVWENVPGVLSSWSGDAPEPPDDAGDGWSVDFPETGDFHAFLDLFRECGYRGCYRVLDAQYVRVAGHERAVPQRRRRVFVVGHLGNDSRAIPVLFDRQSLSGNPAPRRKAGKGTATDVAPSLVSSGRGVERCGETRGQDPVVAEVAPTLNAHFGEKQGLEDQHIRGGADSLLPSVANTLTRRMRKGINTTLDEGQTLIPTTGAVFDDGVAHALRAAGFDASEDGTGRGTPIVPVSVAPPCTSNPYGDHESREGLLVPIAFSSKDYGNDAMSAVSPTLRSMGNDGSHANGGGQVAIAIQERAVSENPNQGPQGAGYRDDGAAYTLEARHHVQAVAFAENSRAELRLCGGDGSVSAQLTTGGGKPGQGHACVAYDMRGREGGSSFEGPHDTANIRAASGGSSRSYVAETWVVRRLTPRECERLQGFPDDWTLIEVRGKPAADGPRYKAIGNSMATNVMRWIGERIQMVEDMFT